MLLLLDFSYQAASTKPFTHKDSINHQLSLMQSKIDSLEKIVMKTEIGTGFFSDVISTNLYMFATIIGLAALISWVYIGRILFIHKKSVGNMSKNMINEHSVKYDSELNDIKEPLYFSVLDGNRSMYFNAKNNNGGDFYIFVFALRSADALLNFDTYNEVSMNDWLETSLKHLSKVEVGDKDVGDEHEMVFKSLERLESVQGDEDKKLVSEISRQLKHLVYTIKQ